MRADRSLANDGLSSALLVVYLDSAQNLPVRRHEEPEAIGPNPISSLISSLLPLHLKNVFTGSLGCGNLSERRASGLVFCESNTSEYRKICVSSLWRPPGISVSRVVVCGACPSCTVFILITSNTGQTGSSQGDWCSQTPSVWSRDTSKGGGGGGHYLSTFISNNS